MSVKFKSRVMAQQSFVTLIKFSTAIFISRENRRDREFVQPSEYTTGRKKITATKIIFVFSASKITNGFFCKLKLLSVCNDLKKKIEINYF